MKKQKKKTPLKVEVQNNLGSIQLYDVVREQKRREVVREQKRREKEIQLVNIAGGFLGIATLIYSGFAYGIELPIILFLVVISNNLCNVK